MIDNPKELLRVAEASLSEFDRLTADIAAEQQPRDPVARAREERLVALRDAIGMLLEYIEQIGSTPWGDG